MTERRRIRRREGISLDAALRDASLLGAALGDPASWSAWLAILRAAFGLNLTDQQREVFCTVAGGRDPPSRKVRELWAVVGRRSGKTRMAAAISAYIAAIEQHRLAPGEIGYVLLLSASKAQASVAFNYVVGFLQASPILRQQINVVTQDEVRLKGNIVIGVHSGSYRTIRGRSLLAVVGDETSYWRSEDSAQPDVEIFRACAPALAASGGIWVGISSGWQKRGLLYDKWREHFGQPNDDDVLVIQAASDQLNPTLDPVMIAKAQAADPEAALSEWQGGFRSSITGFLSDADIDSAIMHGRPAELPPQSSLYYRAFTDASAGRGAAYTFAIGHRESGKYIVDVIRGTHKTFDPQATTEAYAKLCKQYRVQTVVGDAYGGAWVEQAWTRCGIAYKRSALAKSTLYLETAPLWARGLIGIPEHPRLLKELRLLERHVHQSGRDSVGPALHGTDDYANAVAGCVQVLASYLGSAYSDFKWIGGDDKPAPAPQRRWHPSLDIYAKPPSLYPREEAPA